jgi:GntR family transcriptional repressor for pyruvate dehydrogenase complex
MNSIKKIKAESLRAQVYAKLKEQLMSGTWKEGEKLPSEHEFCAMFGVSRVTVRAALQQLGILGFIETKHGGGTFVKKFSSIEKVDTLHPMFQIQKNQDLITVMEYRKIIEKGIVGIAMEKITAEDIRFLEETLAAMIKNASDIDSFFQADLAFHNHLAKTTQNSMIIKVHELINEILTTAMKDMVQMIGTKIGPIYHKKIIDALKKKDKAECEKQMEAHIEENIRVIHKQIKADALK